MRERYFTCELCGPNHQIVHYCTKASEVEPETKPFPLVKIKPTWPTIEARYGYGIEAMQ